MPLPHVYGLYALDGASERSRRPDGHISIRICRRACTYTVLNCVLFASTAIQSVLGLKIKISTVLHSCGSLCKWRFLIMSQISIRSHAVQNQAFQISLHGDPLPACTSQKIVFPLISSNVGIHFLEHCGKHFTDLIQISHSKTANNVQCQRNGSVHISNFQCWDIF